MKLVEAGHESYPCLPQGFSLEKVAQTSADLIYGSAHSGIGTEGSRQRKNQEQAFTFVERLLETLMIGRTDKYRTLDTIWILRRTSATLSHLPRLMATNFS